MSEGCCCEVAVGKGASVAAAAGAVTEIRSGALSKPDAGSNTVTLRAAVERIAGKVALSCVALCPDEGSAVPFRRTTEVEVKPLPITVIDEPAGESITPFGDTLAATKGEGET